MGKEYEIKCSAQAVAKFDDFVRRSNFFHSFNEVTGLCNLKLSGDENEWLDGSAKLREGHIYFCDYMTSTSEIATIFRRIIDHAKGSCVRSDAADY